MDKNGDGLLDVKEVMSIVESVLGFAVDPDEIEFAKEILEAAGDTDKDGKISIADINRRGMSSV